MDTESWSRTSDPLVPGTFLGISDPPPPIRAQTSCRPGAAPPLTLNIRAEDSLSGYVLQSHLKHQNREFVSAPALLRASGHIFIIYHPVSCVFLIRLPV